MANQKTAIGRGLAAIRAKKNVFEPSFALHFFRCIEPWMSQQGTGTTFKAISGAFLKELDAVLPPLAEQKVIADKLDTLLTQVDNTKARLERIPEILKRFRQSVLAAAVSGRLTEGWRISHQDHDSWQKIDFSTLTCQLRSGSAEKPSDDSEGVPILRSSAVRPREIDFSDIKYLSYSKSLKDNNYLKEKDLLFTRLSGSAEYVGNCAMVRDIEREYQYPDRLFCARLKDPQQGRRSQ